MKRKSSARVEAALNKVTPAAENFVHTAVDRVGPMVHDAADRVGPLAQSAADRIGPLAQSAADRIAPIAQSAADRIAPIAQSAADRIGPLAHQAAERVGPYAQQAADRVGPYAHQAAERVGPLAVSAKQRGAQAAHDAIEMLGPRLDEALERVSPAVEAARERVNDDLLPRLSGALTAAASTPIVVEAGKRGRATLAAARGDLVLPEEKSSKGRVLKRLAVLAAMGGIAFVAVRKLLGSKDADWQAARPTTPYAAPTPPQPASAGSDADTTVNDATAGAADTLAESEVDAPAEADPQEGESAHLAYQDVNDEPTSTEVGGEGSLEPAEGSVETVEASLESADSAADDPLADTAALTEDDFGGSTETATEWPDEAPPAVVEDPSNASDVTAGDVAASDPTADADAGQDDGEGAQPKYSGEGVYVGDEPPEGFIIKGNDRSMKYHLPDSGGYSQTTAEVWFNSEEAAQRSGFVRAKG